MVMVFATLSNVAIHADVARTRKQSGPMSHKTYFISRHPGAVAWAQAQGLRVDRWVTHLDITHIQSGDTVAGTLPIHLAAEVCARGATYLHLSLDLPAHLRGVELNAQDMRTAQARLERFAIHHFQDQGVQ